MTKLTQQQFDFDEKKIRQLLTVNEIFEKCNEELLLELGEDSRVEHKSEKFSGESIGCYISMWANTAPYGGLLVLGQ